MNNRYMRNIVLALLAAVMSPLAVCAQTAAAPSAAVPSAVKFGYFSYSEVMKSMPDYAVAQQNLASLRKQYEDETKRSEEEFNQKYELFLDAQGELDGPILKKRQAELQELLTKSIEFKNEARRLLRQARADMYAPLRKKLAALLANIGRKHGYAFILNTDGDALPYVNPANGEDITDIVKGAVAASAAKHAPVQPAVDEDDDLDIDDITPDDADLDIVK